jgi:hypothetical protein
MANSIARSAPFALETRARTCASRKFGKAMAINMRMMAMTIKSSISVKPRPLVPSNK